MVQTLVTEERYRYRSKDYTSSQSDVVRALEDAVHEIQDRLGRQLSSAVRTETGWAYNGKLSPRVTPITVDPVRADGTSFDDTAPWRWAGFLGPGAFDAPFERRKVTYTYTGGWTAYDGVTPLPMALETAIVATAKWLMAPAGTSADIMAGAVAATVGDVSVTYKTPRPAAGGIPPGVWETISRYRYRGLGAV